MEKRGVGERRFGWRGEGKGEEVQRREGEGGGGREWEGVSVEE